MKSYNLASFWQTICILWIISNCIILIARSEDTEKVNVEEANPEGSANPEVEATPEKEVQLDAKSGEAEQETQKSTQVVEDQQQQSVEDGGKDVLVLPPAMVNVPEVKPKRFFRKLKNLLFRKKPIFEELLDIGQQKVLEVADKIFSLKYNSLPVKKLVNFDASSTEENLEIQAFELLGGIVGRAVRNAIICSMERNSTSRMGKECSHEGLSVLNSNTGDFDDSPRSPDKLCSPDDPETGTSIECQRRRNVGKKGSKIDVHKGPPLDNVVVVHSTKKSTPSIRLPPSGSLREALDKNVWDIRNPTKFILNLVPYEFLKQRSTNDQVNQQIISAYKERYGNHEPLNIVEIKWPTIWPKRQTVIQLAARYMSTADQLARLLLRWHRKSQIKLDKVHTIGFSFGAHLAGVIGAIIKERVGVPVERITGLDPLGWGFDQMDGYGVEPELDLTKDDAAFVDIIHTSSPDSNYHFIHYGSNEKRGTVDFYPNNGRAQYCEPTDGLCHHFYSVVLYAATIVNENFNGCKCESWDDFIIKRKCTPCLNSVKMGEHVDKEKAKGVYYLVTA